MRDLVRIVAEAAGGGTILSLLSGTEPWRPRPLRADGVGWARVALVQSRASLLAGDDVSLEIVVGRGAALEIVELGAMVALDGRGGPDASLSVAVSVADRGRLIWLSQPLVAAAGCRVVAHTEVSLLRSGRMLRGEGMVFGRAGEQCGVVSSRTRFTADERPVLDETISTEDRFVLGSQVVAGSAPVLSALTLAGMRDPEPFPHVMQAYGEATIWRAAGAAVELESVGAALVRRWRALLSGGVEFGVDRDVRATGVTGEASVVAGRVGGGGRPLGGGESVVGDTGDGA